MRKHSLDVASMVAGLVFVGLSLAYLIGHYADVAVDGRWVLPLALIGLGIAGLAAGISRTTRPDRHGPTA